MLLAGQADAQPRQPQLEGPTTSIEPEVGEPESALAVVEPEPEPPPKPALPDVPDLTQTDPDLGLPGGGSSYCGPVSVSNSIIYLGENGFDRLLPVGDDRRSQQLQLVGILSSRSYMGTDPWGGTGANGILRGLERYLKRADYEYEQLAYQGWRGHQRRFRTGQRTPQLEWLRSALHRGGVAFINVGWYRPLRPSKQYVRRGGHWLTVVAAGKDAQGNPDELALVLHDPAPYAGDEPTREFVKAELLEEGWLVPRASSIASFPAKGYYVLGGGMHTKRPEDVAILDGAITLVLKAPDSDA